MPEHTIVTQYFVRARLERLGRQNHYEVLGIFDKHATDDDIREVFKKKALDCHPDRVLFVAVVAQ